MIGYSHFIIPNYSRFFWILHKNLLRFNTCGDLGNTLKHRHLVEIEVETQVEMKNRKTDWKLLDFTRDGNKYPKVTGTDSLDQYKSEILELFHKVGIKINNYVRAQNIVNHQ